MFKTYKKFIDYIKSLDSGLYRIDYVDGETEYWLLDVPNLRVRFIYDNYSMMNSISEGKLDYFQFATFNQFANQDFFKFIQTIKEL